MLGQDSKKYIVVIGDIMLDEYVFGTVNRVSPESCCPILHIDRTFFQLGGAANVAYQIQMLGRRVFLAGIIGNDKSGKTILSELTKNGIDSRFVYKHEAITTKKSRYINDVHQQMFRVDDEEYNSFITEEMNDINSFILNNTNKIDCIVLSDYNKGVLTIESCQTIIKTANKNGIPTIVDIKVPDESRYKGATIIKGNLKEFSAFFNSTETGLDTIEGNMCLLKQKTNTSFVVVTLGKNGIAGIDDKENVIKHNANQVLVYDVTGAGDIVTAYLGVLFDTMPFESVLYYANKAAGLKVAKFGNSFVSLDELFSAPSKLKTISEILDLIKGRKTVFTNGCFDVLHAGHVDLLQYAKSKGELLIVGINSDNSVKRLKGKNRPINTLEMRARVLSALNVVDYIVCFEEDTPEKIIQEISPDILIKGGDYSIETIVGADFVLQNGGEVEAMPFRFNMSTTKILASL